ncbi:MAG: hypothetical protein C4325_00905 [Blastocatellia bacterium]
MKEAIFIILVIVALAGLTALRYRRQIFTLLQIWQQLKVGGQSVDPIESDNRSKTAPCSILVNCSKCGRWISENSAVRLGKTVYFCSPACLELHSRRS